MWRNIYTWNSLSVSFLSLFTHYYKENSFVILFVAHDHVTRNVAKIVGGSNQTQAHLPRVLK